MVILWSHERPTRISAHPTALPTPGCWEQEDMLGGEWLATAEPGAMGGSWASSAGGVEMGHKCNLDHHHDGGNLPEGLCVPTGEELCGGLCE